MPVDSTMPRIVLHSSASSGTMSSTTCRTLVVEGDYPSWTAFLELMQLSGHIAMAAATFAEAQWLLRWRPECVSLT
jgi:hypothetical protein